MIEAWRPRFGVCESEAFSNPDITRGRVCGGDPETMCPGLDQYEGNDSPIRIA